MKSHQPTSATAAGAGKSALAAAPKRAISIYDVAKRARVSIATVSDTLNRKGRVSETTRNRILRVCQQLGYRPHPAARSLSRSRLSTAQRQRTGIFGFTPVHGKWAGAYTPFLDGAAEASLERQRAILYQPLKWEGANTLGAPGQFAVDGRLLVGELHDAIVEAFEADQTPVVVVGDHECSKPVWNINLDCYAAGETAVNHLWELGHRRLVLYCEGMQLELAYQRQIERGYHDALENRGIPLEDQLVIKQVPGRDELCRLLTQSERPTAVVAILGRTATLTFSAAKEARLEVPNQLSILMFGRHDPPVPMVTHLDPVHEEVGKRGMELLMDLVERAGERTPARTLLPAKLVNGGTCAPPA
jgi:LacI family transcriptional regulator